ASVVAAVSSSVFAADVRRVERGSLILENIPDTPASVKERLRLYQAVRGAVFLDFSPDGRGVLIQTRFGETNQLHRVESPLAMRRQLSFYDEPVNSALYRPGKWPERTVLFSRDNGGDEQFQLYLLNDRNGDVARLSDGKTRNTDAVFSRDGKWVAWTSVPADSARYRVMVADASDPKSARAVLEEDGSWSSADFSFDNKTLAVTRDVSVSEQQIWLVDLTIGRKEQIKPSPVKIFRGSPKFSPDGKSLYYISDEDSEYRRIVRYDLNTEDEDVLTDNLPWDVEAMEMSPNGRTFAVTVNEGGTSRLYLMDAKRGKLSAGPKLAPGEVENMRFSPDSRRLGFTLNGTTGRDVFVWDMAKRPPVQWTDSEIGGLDKADFVAPELVEYDTFDEVDGKRRKVSAFVYKPKGVARAPVLISIHGGPESQFRPNFNSFIQYLVQELKIAVVAPNVRGSTGYGKYFVELDNGNKRMDSVKDIGATLDWIGKQGDLDGRRVAVYGGSYGGFMSYASMIEYNDRLTAGISVVGISNFATFLNNTSGYRRDLRRAEYGDERDPRMREYLEKISPLTNVSKIKKPMLIIQGANDPRVPQSEAAQMLKAIRGNGAEAWYILAKDEGHGFQKKSNRDAQNAAIASFLKLKLLGQRLD
ncbi:MAG: S9 family peptidase, partial [Alphaproteobacteria bacterium]|nr:S9 family peptidase [Alphaproteobacteria bacterium]